MIGTPNRGSPFMDWCAVSLALGSVDYRLQVKLKLTLRG